MKNEVSNMPSHEWDAPFVSVHLLTGTTSSEEIGFTLRALFRQHYARDRYEVVVIHAGDPEPHHWGPIDACCEMLGPNFRFEHYHHSRQGEAGALRHAHALMDERAESIVVLQPGQQPGADLLLGISGALHRQNEGLVGVRDVVDQEEIGMGFDRSVLEQTGGWARGVSATKRRILERGWSESMLQIPTLRIQDEEVGETGLVLCPDLLPRNFRCRAIMSTAQRHLSWEIH